MERTGDADPEFPVPVQRLRARLDEAPVRVAILFGSHATGRAHARSDLDIAVEFEGVEPGDPEYNETFLGLSADLSRLLETDDIDLVDIRSLSPSLARSVFDTGVLLVGTEKRVETLRGTLLSDDPDERSPHERFDDALRRIDEHLT
ncbi:type VII toxin-antitoxin system MntA family adenylyltransferase antitoxin [Halosimplex pelagicum]|uniref:Nucleotidyltransferase domain-containing protein n=1 Tax=Halosimplex pelagicum TaxID=869886 RepID=A0A7D5TG25_9EURY|nr:nucleotidyltransferase domain-containing protein [Halosimplex pelagicum]QLH81116.1 nucleotidyltransferase domain-containing protein [Halosimplex pelagicum]